MRDLIRQIVDGYKGLKLEGQDEGYVVFTGKEADTRQAVAIKILPRLLGQDPQIGRQFDRLARTIRQLNHPNIASIRKVGEESGLPYIVTFIQAAADGSQAPYYLMFVASFPSIEVLQKIMSTPELQEVAADAVRISTGGPPVMMIGL